MNAEQFTLWIVSTVAVCGLALTICVVINALWVFKEWLRKRQFRKDIEEALELDRQSYLVSNWPRCGQKVERCYRYPVKPQILYPGEIKTGGKDEDTTAKGE